MHAPSLGPWDRPKPSRHVIERAGVLELLDRGALDPLTIIRAPAGAGKTTCVLQWLELRQVPDVTWVNALRVPGDTREQRARAVWEHLWTRTPVPGSGRRTIVIDDVGRGLGGQLDALIVESARNPDGPRWILLTRVLGGIEERRGLNNLDATLLAPEHLRFTAAESADYLAGSILAGYVPEVRALTDGAAWLLHTAKEFALGAAGPHETVLARTLEAVLGDAMLRVEGCAVGPEDLALLLRLAILPTFTPEAAGLLNSGRAAGPLLTLLEEAGLSMRIGAGCREEYVFGVAVREGLRRWHAALPSDARRYDESLGARYAMEHGDPATALELAVSGGDYELGSLVLLRHADSFLNGGLGSVAARWLPMVPLGEMARFPLLAVALGLLYNVAGIHRLRSRELLRMAAATAGQRGSDPAGPGEPFLMDAIRSIAMRVGGIGDRGSACAIRALDRYAAMAPRERDGIGGAEELLLAQLGISLHLAGFGDGARTAAAHAADAAHNGAQRLDSGYATTLVAYLYAFEGDMTAARSALEELDARLWEDPATPPYLTSPYRLARAIVALEEADWESARRYLDMMRKQLATSEFWPVMRYCAGILDIASGNVPSHLAQLELALSRQAGLPPIGAVGEVFTSATLAWLHLARGDLNRALEQLEASGEDPTVILLRARIELARNRPEKALELIGGCTVATPRERHNAAVLRLAAQLGMGRGDLAREQLEVVRGLSEACGLWLGLLMLPDPDLCRVKELFDEAGVEVGRVAGYSSPIPGNLSTVNLTDREHAILSELVRTGNAAQIAERQFVSVNTVKSQLRSIYRKLGVSGRVAALREAQSHGLI